MFVFFFGEQAVEARESCDVFAEISSRSTIYRMVARNTQIILMTSPRPVVLDLVPWLGRTLLRLFLIVLAQSFLVAFFFPSSSSPPISSLPSLPILPWS